MKRLLTIILLLTFLQSHCQITKFNGSDITTSTKILGSERSKVLGINISSGGSGGSSLEISGLVSLWDYTSIVETANGATVSTWYDAFGSNDATAVNTPILNTDDTVGSPKQIYFGSGAYYNLGTPSNLNFIPTTDSFSIVARIGGDAPSAGTIISKESSSVYQWGLFVNNTTQLAADVGGVTGTGTIPTIQPNSLLIMTVNATTCKVIMDGVEYISFSIGSATDSANVNIGAYNDGGFLYNAGTLDFIAVYNKELSSGEISAIESEFQIN